MAGLDSPFLRGEWRQDGRVLRIEGELDMAAARLLLDEIGQGREELTLDLRGLTFIDSIGLGTLVQLHRDLGVLEIIATEDGPVMRLINLTRLEQLLPVTIAEE